MNKMPMSRVEALERLEGAALSCEEAISGAWDIGVGTMSDEVLDGFQVMADDIRSVIRYIINEGL